MKKILIGLLILALISSLALGLVSCGEPACEHKDSDDNSLCDKCSEEYKDGKDLICQHRDTDDNSLCDKCGEDYTDGKDLHVYTQKNTHESYLATAADCENAATYYYSCICGDIGTETFAYGDANGHRYNQKNTDDTYFAAPADCKNGETYFYSCSCGEKSTETFTHGDALNVHTPLPEIQENLKEASCTQGSYDLVVYCDVCDDELSRTFHTISPTEIHLSESGVCSTCGAQESSPGLKFALNADGKSYTLLNDGDCTESDVIIDIYNGLDVTAISSYAFGINSTVRSLTLGKSITYIGTEAFYDCLKLTSLYISDIAAWSKLSFNDYDDNPLTKARNLYLNGALVTELLIPNDITLIGDYAFSYGECITSIVIPDTVLTIGKGAFWGCSNVTSITIGKNVTDIKNNAFTQCSALTNIVIPDSVKSIGGVAFSNCSKLSSIAIGNGVTSIGASAFSGCTSLTEIAISDSVTYIGQYAFRGTPLTSISFGANSRLESIDKGAFQECKNLASFAIPKSLTLIASGAFLYCTNLKSVTFAEQSQLLTIESNAFSGCSSLESITIPKSVTTIQSGAFKNCKSLSNVTFENTDGWWINDSNYATSGESISAEILKKTDEAAQYLSSTYSNKAWFCT